MDEDILLERGGAEYPGLGEGGHQVGHDVQVPPRAQLVQHGVHRHVAQTGAGF